MLQFEIYGLFVALYDHLIFKSKLFKELTDSRTLINLHYTEGI